jgi:ribonuclease HI
MTNVKVYTEGACKGNPGPGGWAYIVRWRGLQPVDYDQGAEPDTTNNRMSIVSAIKALESLPQELQPHQVTLFSDSEYLIKGITVWIHGWKKNGWKKVDWKKGDGVAIKNQELWQELDKAQARHVMTWKWLGAATDSEVRELVDVMARIESGSRPNFAKLKARQKLFGEV